MLNYIFCKILGLCPCVKKRIEVPPNIDISTVRLREKKEKERQSIDPLDGEEEFYEELLQHYNETNNQIVDIGHQRRSLCSDKLKRLSGLGVSDQVERKELKKRLEAKSRANVIGWQIVSAKSAPKCRTNSRHFQHRYSSVLDEEIKARIYKENLPLGVPRSIKSLSYCSTRDSDYVVKTVPAPLQIFSSPIKKTGLLKSRDGGLRNSYKILRDGLKPRKVDFDPEDLAEVDPEYVRRSLGKIVIVNQTFGLISL